MQESQTKLLDGRAILRQRMQKNSRMGARASCTGRWRACEASRSFCDSLSDNSVYLTCLAGESLVSAIMWGCTCDSQMHGGYGAISATAWTNGPWGRTLPSTIVIVAMSNLSGESVVLSAVFISTCPPTANLSATAQPLGQSRSSHLDSQLERGGQRDRVLFVFLRETDVVDDARIANT